jgi:hypothetical protein
MKISVSEVFLTIRKKKKRNEEIDDKVLKNKNQRGGQLGTTH